MAATRRAPVLSKKARYVRGSGPAIRELEESTAAGQQVEDRRRKLAAPRRLGHRSSIHVRLGQDVSDAKHLRRREQHNAGVGVGPCAATGCATRCGQARPNKRN